MTTSEKDIAPSVEVNSADSFNSPVGRPHKGEHANTILVQSRSS